MFIVHITKEALRRSAELTMHKLVRTIFSKLYALDPVSEEKKLLNVPSMPVAGTDPSSSAQPLEPVSDDPITSAQPVTPTTPGPHDVTPKFDCMLSALLINCPA